MDTIGVFFTKELEEIKISINLPAYRFSFYRSVSRIETLAEMYHVNKLEKENHITSHVRKMPTKDTLPGTIACI